MFRHKKTQLSRYSVRRRKKFSSLLSMWKFKKKENVLMPAPKVHKVPEDSELLEAKKFWNVDYEGDIYEALKASEENNRSPYMMRDFSYLPHYQELRFCLLSLQKHITDHEHLSRNTLHLGMYLLDMYMNKFRVSDRNIYSVAGICLILASKMEDIDTSVPTISSFDAYLNYSKRTTAMDYIHTEFAVMQMVNFNLIIPTAVTFIDYFACSVVTTEDFEQQKTKSSLNFTSFKEYLQNAQDIVLKFVDSTLKDPYLVKEVPSKIAAACILSTRSFLRVSQVWPPLLVQITQYEINELVLYTSRIEQLCEISNNKHGEILSSPESGYRTAGEDKNFDSDHSDSDIVMDSDMSIDD